jgi:hypothetical protein
VLFHLNDALESGTVFLEVLFKRILGGCAPNANAYPFRPVHEGTLKSQIASPGSANDIVSSLPQLFLGHLGHGNEEFHDTPRLRMGIKRKRLLGHQHKVQKTDLVQSIGLISHNFTNMQELFQNFSYAGCLLELLILPSKGMKTEPVGYHDWLS